jgi:predicted RecB family nuclease
MKMIGAEVVAGYLRCERKGLLLLAGEDQGTPHELEDVIRFKKDTAKEEYIQSLRGIAVHDYSHERFIAGLDCLLVGAELQAHDLKAPCDALIKERKSKSQGIVNYEPVVVSGGYLARPDDVTRLALSGYILAQLQETLPRYGVPVTEGATVRRVGLKKIYEPIRKSVEVLRERIKSPHSEAPRVILNQHCKICQFRHQCMEVATKQDDLSLLDRVTPKIAKKYARKGIFTVTQLSYLFRLKRFRKRRTDRPVRFEHEMQALAIRTGKILVKEQPMLLSGTPALFLDIEGTEDQKFYYLFGLLIIDGEDEVYHNFWADRKEDEETAWMQLIKVTSQFPESPIYHYGNYEDRAIEKLQKRYPSTSFVKKGRLTNVNSLIFGKIYFPVKSNGLKDIARHLGMSWTEPDASGIQSVIWRFHWDRTGNSQYKESLITYNREDCSALSLLVNAISAIGGTPDHSKFDFVERPENNFTEVGNRVHDDLEGILQSAHMNYDKTRVSVRRSRLASQEDKKRRGRKPGSPGHFRCAPAKFNRIVQQPSEKWCPQHRNELLRKSEDVVERYVIDLAITKSGCRKSTTKYFAYKSYCRKTGRVYIPSGVIGLGYVSFGHTFQAWTIYQRIVMRLPYKVVIQIIEELFWERISESTIANFIVRFSELYEPTEKSNHQRLLESAFIHVDEMTINIQGVTQYVWVFTDGTHVVFKLSETRESTVVHDFLSDYKGVLVTDFYPGYDAVTCRQQKCWVHLIRDLNEELRKSPFDGEFEAFVSAVRDMLVPIIDATHKYGLKRRHLAKFQKSVDRFYAKIIVDKEYVSEASVKFQHRFLKFKERLFTFLSEDSIPWNNNTAERAIRHLAVQRKISGTFYKSIAPGYLVLLGIAQSCRFQDKSFLQFMLSREMDIDSFRGRTRARKHTQGRRSRGKVIKETLNNLTETSK